jgi:hypothetical protein
VTHERRTHADTVTDISERDEGHVSGQNSRDHDHDVHARGHDHHIPLAVASNRNGSGQKDLAPKHPSKRPPLRQAKTADRPAHSTASAATSGAQQRRNEAARGARPPHLEASHSTNTSLDHSTESVKIAREIYAPNRSRGQSSDTHIRGELSSKASSRKPGSPVRDSPGTQSVSRGSPASTLTGTVSILIRTCTYVHVCVCVYMRVCLKFVCLYADFVEAYACASELVHVH